MTTKCPENVYKKYQLLSNTITNLQNNHKKLKKVFVILQKDTTLDIEEKDILTTLILMKNKKINLYQLHKEIRDEKAIQYIAKQIGPILAS